MRGFIPDGARSGPYQSTQLFRHAPLNGFGVASQPIGDKSPHHKSQPNTRNDKGHPKVAFVWYSVS
ncbi:hypothetical protein PseAD21_17455 [Pseudomonas sp. AD21]|nr:hypothetical protein PseAD21_17455 [Pseudomonas sp. AD21]